jgi:hypothetical protein
VLHAGTPAVQQALPLLLLLMLPLLLLLPVVLVLLGPHRC